MKQGISKKLMKNYIFMYMLTLSLTIVIIFVLLNLGNDCSSYDKGNYAREIMNDDYNKIDISFIKEHNGTAFFVDKDLNVISLCGNDYPNSFTMSEWTAFINKVDVVEPDFQCSIDYNEKNQFWFVVKLPVAVNCIINFNVNTSKEVLSESLFIVSIFCLVCFIIVFIYIYIYSKLTSKYFVKPLTMFCNMVKNLENKKYSERLKFTKDDEFGVLAQSFNKLADSLEEEKNLRKASEDNRKRLILDVSHDLKNPLMSIIGSLELCLKNNNIDEKQKHYIKMAYDSGIRADLLIKELFEYSKLESPDYKLNLEKIDICEYMRMQISNEIEAIEESGFEGEYDIPDKEIYAEIDIVHFGRVIHNLISNSIKYNKENTKIKIKVKEAENNIEIIIEDNGIGINKELSIDIFNVFVRGDNEEQAPGTGLGLTIAKKIVNMHNGTISLETDINRGCTFIISIPKK